MLGGIGCLVQARFIDPKVMGYFGAFGILAQYLCFLHVGWLTTLHRDYPYWIGKGDPERANRIVAVAEAWVLLVCGSVGVLYSCLTLASLFVGNFMAATAWATQLVMASLSFYSLYLGATYRSAHEFVTWAKIGAVSSIVAFAMLPLVAWLGFWGLCIRGAAPAALSGAACTTGGRSAWLLAGTSASSGDCSSSVWPWISAVSWPRPA